MASTDQTRLNILVVSSVGGHLTEVLTLREFLEPHRVSLVVNDTVKLPDYPFAAAYQISHAERDLKVVQNFAEAAWVLAREQPDVIVSTGAGLVVPFAVLARALGDCRIIYLESAAAVERPTLTGRLMYHLAHDFYYPWPTLGRYFPKGRHRNFVFAGTTT